MFRIHFRRLLPWLALALTVWLGLRYLLPVTLPFLLAGALALLSEPLVKAFQHRLRLPRAAATGIGVSICLLIAILLLMTLCAFLLRQLQDLAQILPDLESSAARGMDALREFFLRLSHRAPEGLQPLFVHCTENLLSGSSRYLDRFSNWLISFASGVIKALPNSLLSFGTWILATYMTSAKLPQIKLFLQNHFPSEWSEQYLPTFKRLRRTVGCWLTAQLKLTGITFAVLTIGFLLLRLHYALAWAALICLVDALPILGIGTILLPWSLVSFLQGDHLQGIGLLAIYTVAALLRCILEPRLVGKHLGLDPLLTLFSLYLGFRFWGVLGMLLAPLFAVTVTQLLLPQEAAGENG